MASRRILIVDDEPDILDSLQSLMESALDNVTVECATSGDAAVEKLGDGWDLIISDFKMPGMTGLEFLYEARKQLPDVPRVMMTAFPDLNVAKEAINSARIETFFTKPLEPDNIISVVEELLQARQRELNKAQAFARALGAKKPKGDDA